MADEQRPEPIFSTRSSHSGADFEAGRIGRPRGGRQAGEARRRPGRLAPLHALADPARLAGRQDHQQDHAGHAPPLQELQLPLLLERRLVEPMLRLDEYGGGDEAEYNSWVILEKAAAVREEAGSRGTSPSLLAQHAAACDP